MRISKSTEPLLYASGEGLLLLRSGYRKFCAGDYAGSDRDYAAAYSFYDKLAAAGDAEAAAHCGRILSELYRREEEGVAYLRRAHEAGNAQAAFLLGYDILFGGDVGETESLFRLAAERGEPAAYCMLGFMYRDGYVGWEDHGKAFRWFLKGAEEGDRCCMSLLAECYGYGIGTPADPSEAQKWSARAGISEVVPADVAELLHWTV